MGLTLHGVVPVIPTPLNDDETLDAPALRRIVTRTLDAGVQGIWVLGTAGEMPNLDYQQRRAVLETAVETVNGRVPVVAGVQHPGVALTIKAAREAQSIGADMLVVRPYYFTYSDEQSVRFHQMVMAAVDLPIVVYRIGPQVLSLEAVERICATTQVGAIKECPGEFRTLQKMVPAVGAHGVPVMIAAGRLMHPAITVGAKGTIAVEASIAPGLCVALYEAATANRTAEAAQLQRQLYRLSDVVMAPDHEVPARIKAALAELGLCKPAVTAPFTAMGPDVVDQIKAALAEVGLR